MRRPVFRPDDVQRIQKYCVDALSDDVSDVFVTTRDLGAVLGVGIEMSAGRRHAVMLFANGTTDGAAGYIAVDMLRQWMHRMGMEDCLMAKKPNKPMPMPGKGGKC